jgi:hypothetical protein
VLKIGERAAGRVIPVPANGESAELATDPKFVGAKAFEE